MRRFLRRSSRTETGARYYVRSAAEADVERVIPVKLAVWEEIYTPVLGAAFSAKAHASAEGQVAFWRRRARATADDPRLFLAEDLRDRVQGVATVDELADTTRTWCQRLADQGELPELDENPGAWPVREVRGVYVLAESRRRGLGTALVQTALGPRPSVARVWRDHEFFRALGYRPVGEPVTVTEGDWAGMTEQLMVRGADG
ncbi:hypothetical protein DCC27_008460 [Auritidibacter sp. NML130574]|nr:hypothetical protein DCC27_008460 [Auritidibacter sp. NML130574]